MPFRLLMTINPCEQFFPLVMNAFQYYVIDSYIKHKDPSQALLLDSPPADGEPDLHHPRRPFSYGEEDDSGGESDLEDGSKGLLYPPDRAIPSGGPKSQPPQVHEYNPDYDGASSDPDSEYFSRTGRRLRKPPTAGSQKSRNSSLMLLPGSRGPSTPGYADEGESIGGRSGAYSRTVIGDDDSTLVNRDDDR